MNDFFRELLSTQGFHPHGYCYLWKPGLVGLHVVSDLLIGLAYVVIGWGLAHFVRRGRGGLPFSGMFVAFGVFIAACGATHFMEVWTLWTPVYWLSGSVKVITAAASVFTAVALPPLIPVALHTLASARLSERRRVDLEDAHRRLTELDELKTRFFANVSHELRTPLTLILGPVEEMLAHSGLPAEDRRRPRTVRRNGELLLRQVNDLLDAAKLEAGRVELSYRTTDLVRLVRFAAAHFESVAQTNAVAFTIESPASLRAEVDPDAVQRVTMNLLGNAVKFTPPGGEVRCIVERAENDARAPVARIAVHDSGPGVAPEARERIFKPFYQADGGAGRRYGGTGLGLAIVADLVELHGGRVTVEDSPLGGAAFAVEIPVQVPAGTPVKGEDSDSVRERLVIRGVLGESAAAPGHDDMPKADPASPLVLVVEDNPEMNQFITEMLGRDYRIDRAFDGREGIDKARELRPDLIVSDVMMPELTGEDLVHELRQHRELDATPILLVSARADDEVRLRLLKEGVQDYLTKPFAAGELRARVRNWIQMKRARDILQRELASTLGNVESLATEIAFRKRELETALEAAHLAFAEAEAASRAKSDFMSVMSHEFRTPLNAITGYVDLLDLGIGGTLSDTQRGYVERVRVSTRHLLALVEDVLTFARIEAGIEQLALDTVDLRPLVAEGASVVEPMAKEKSLDLRVRLSEAPVKARTDPAKIRQILLNLASNAVKFTERGEVAISLQSDDGMAVLHVRDTGPGISAEHREKMFEPFWQGDASKTRTTGGTGLGLTVARRLADLLGASIEVESEPGLGTTVTVRLPLT